MRFEYEGKWYGIVFKRDAKHMYKATTFDRDGHETTETHTRRATFCWIVDLDDRDKSLPLDEDSAVVRRGLAKCHPDDAKLYTNEAGRQHALNDALGGSTRAFKGAAKAAYFGRPRVRTGKPCPHCGHRPEEDLQTVFGFDAESTSVASVVVVEK